MPINFGCSVIPFVATRGPNVFSCVHSEDLCCQPTIYTKICVGPRLRCLSIFSPLWFNLWPVGGQIHLFLVYSVNPGVLTDVFSNSHHTFLRPRTRYQLLSALCSPILGHKVAKFVFLVCALQPLAFNQSFPNSHQVFSGPCSTPQYIFATD